jgi:drug/metabolite transporter (DMT)-like permease
LIGYFWLFSILAPVFFAVSNLVDNHVLHIRLGDPISYDILSIWPSLPFALLIFLSTPVSFAFDAYVVGTLVGFAFAFLYVLYEMAMMKEQGTNVISVIYTNPLFVAILATASLHEALTALDVVGILLLTTSAFLVLYERFDMKNVALGLALAYSFGSAVTRVVGKSALGHVDVWSYLFWFIVGEGLGSLVLVPLHRDELRRSIAKLDRTTFFLILTTTIFSFVAFALLYFAFSLGPVALASGMTAIQPTILLVYSSVLLHYRPDALPAERVKGRWASARKVGAVLLIVVGALALTGL